MNTNQESSDGNSVQQQCAGDPKWAVVVNDRLIPMPRRRITSAVIHEQASIQRGHILFRDHNSPSDPVIPNDSEVDLGEGNVFYTEPTCELTDQSPCAAPAKLAYVVDDRWEVTITPRQTGKTLRNLFALPDDAELIRDYESPHDQTVADEGAALFANGPVFRTRKRCVSVTIIVNGRPKVIQNKTELAFNEIVSLAFENPPTGQNVVLTITYRRGPAGKPEGTLIAGEKVKIKEGMIFNVTATDKS